jgi:hypothetical protein
VEDSPAQFEHLLVRNGFVLGKLNRAKHLHQLIEGLWSEGPAPGWQRAAQRILDSKSVQAIHFGMKSHHVIPQQKKLTARCRCKCRFLAAQGRKPKAHASQVGDGSETR